MEKNEPPHIIMRQSFILLFLILGSCVYGQSFATSSILASGINYKFRVQEEGVYELTYEQLKELPDIPLASLSAAQFKIFINGGGIVPANNSAQRIDDWVEASVITEGLSDNSFDEGDRILFYVSSPDILRLQENEISRSRNPYDFYNYFILHISPSAGNPRTMPMSNPGTATGDNIRQVRQHFHHEQELINLQDHALGYHGSGIQWYGESFHVTRERSFLSSFPTLPPFADNEVRMKFRFAARTPSGANLSLIVNDMQRSYSFSGTNLGDPESIVARTVAREETFAVSKLTKVDFRFRERNSIDEGWLDYLSLDYATSSPVGEEQIFFYLPRNSSSRRVTLTLPSHTDYTLVDISSPEDCQQLPYSQEEGIFSFITSASDKARRFCLFRSSQSFPTPEYVETLNNQNLHALTVPECVVIYHPDFLPAVEKWVSHRSSYSEISIAAININDIYNEFSGGAQDPRAIRDFARMCHERNEDFEWLVLFGNGSFDYRHVNKQNPFGSFVPVFETAESMSPISSFPTDDYYGLLSQNEGSNLKGALDISIGRIPVNTLEEAMIIVDKIIHYDTNPSTYGEWRVRHTFLADDEDTNRHLRDADRIAEKVRRDSVLQVQKVYFDAYQQESTAGGIRIPGASNALNESMLKGNLICTYLGHGGPFGIAQERVMEIPQIQSWTNQDKLPLFITATCTFAPYDNPYLASAGKLLVSSRNGGAIAVFTTVRPVYASSNSRLTEATLAQVFTTSDGSYQTLGEILKNAKNSNSLDTTRENARKFSILGDPTLHLAIPTYQVVTTSINGKDAQSQLDTLRPLEVVTIEGYVADKLGDIATDFTGTVYATIFDKEEVQYTLGQDPGSLRRAYQSQDDILWKGKVPVSNGIFQFECVLPKSVNPEFGRGKISYYAHNSSYQLDASGAHTKVIVGGFPQTQNLEDEPPTIELFMDHLGFISGEETGSNPLLIVNLSDDLGINLSTNTIGHDIRAILDENTGNPIVLTSFFEPSIDDYRIGTIHYPFRNLAPGTHTITVRAWDVAHQFAEATIEFVVKEGEAEEIFGIQAFPNPFQSETCIRVQSNIAPGEYQGTLEIYTIQGKQVDQIPIRARFEGSMSNCIPWIPGRNSVNIVPGLYLCVVKLKGKNNLELYSSVHKLVFLHSL